MGFARRGALLAMATVVLVVAPTASPSQLLDDNASGVKLAVNGKGEALVTYTANGQQKRVLAWDAVNANPPVARRQAGRVQARLLGRLRQVPRRRTGRRSARRACRTTARRSRGRWPRARRRTARTGRSRRGSASSRTTASRVRPRGRVGAAPLALDAARCPCSTITLDRASSGSDHLFGTYTLDGKGIYGFGASTRRQPDRRVRPQHLRRHVQLGVRRRAGSARTAS